MSSASAPATAKKTSAAAMYMIPMRLWSVVDSQPSHPRGASR
jgi:hypothetical protein